MRKPSPSLAMRFAAGHAHVLEAHLGVALLVVVAEDREAADDGDAGRVERDEHHRLLAVPRAVRIRSCP